MNRPKISIVVPSYNKKQYIRRTLDSIFSQSYKNFEVIIQDGGSTDGTMKIIRSFERRYPRNIRSESKKDGGQLDAINKGLKKAKGDLLAFINADDVYENDDAFASVVSSYLINTQALWFAGKGKIINQNDKEIARFWSFIKNWLIDINSYRFLLWTSNYLYQPSVFLTRRGYSKLRKFDGVYGYVFEYAAWLKLGRTSMPVVVDKILSSFRISRENMSSMYYEHLFKKDIEIVKKFTDNWLIIYTHKLNNFARILTRKILWN